MNSRQKALNELWAWTQESGTHFTHKLFDLIAKADGSNRAKLARAFPDEVEFFEAWQSGSEFEIFYRHRSSLEPGYQRELARILQARQLEPAYRKSVQEITLQEAVKRGWN